LYSGAAMRIFIIDGQVVFREGLKAVLGASRDCELVGEAPAADITSPDVLAARPDLLVVDPTLSGDALKTAIRTFKQRSPDAEVALLTSKAVAQDLIDAVAAGARGYILKSETGEAIVNAFRRIARGQHYVTPSLDHIFTRLRQARFPPTVLDVLSPRERHVFRLVTEGLDAAGIAERFGVSRKTIETHKCRILKKFGLDNTAALVRFAALQGLMSRPEPAPQWT
jgi:two-component system, NarL family, response regulator NreC